MNIEYKFKKTALAVSLGLLATFNTAIAQDSEEDKEIEEVVVKASRLQGSAAAVIEERRNQAFVADILGAEEMSKTGDSDAASALRRVTGLTLVDGKYIYVRGLGERYSSARLNGATIPSPDLTRNVIPLDIFPSSIIESLSVQKAYSPSMPAAFGGGAIDIRTKTVPNEFVANIEIGVGYDNSATSGFTHNGNKNGIPANIKQAIVDYRGDFGIRSIVDNDKLVDNVQATRAEQAAVINQNLLKSLPRDLVMKDESLDPAYNIKANIGNSFDEDFFGGKIGFLAALAYDTSYDFLKKKTSVISENATTDCSTSLSENLSRSCFITVTESQDTIENERFNAVLNLGYKLDNHELSWSNIYLKDSEDESSINLRQSPNLRTIVESGEADRTHEFKYEERTLEIMQFIGKHTFTDYMGIGFDWQYTDSEAKTDIPTDVIYRFNDQYNSETGEYLSSRITADDNRATYSFIDLEDHVESYSGNVTLPLYLTDLEIEFKAGYDFSSKGRSYSTSSFAVHNDTGIFIPVNGSEDSLLSITNYLSDDLLNGNDIFVDFNEPTAPNADDYLAAQKINAGYAAFDIIYKGLYRFSGGIRYEDFKQTSLATSSLIFSKSDIDLFFNEDKILDGTINEDDTFAAFSFTYLGGEDYQIRLGYGETVVRPDLREVVPVQFFDPSTDIPTIGRVDLQSSDLKNYDARFEYYGGNGDNYSIGLFYKDIKAPIESVLFIGDEDYRLSFINGKEAEVYGVEVEWLKDLTFITDGLFTSGNITLSDSEVTIDRAFSGNLTNAVKRMNGHSEYVMNLQVNYDSSNGDHSTSLVYNVFGERIIASGVGGREDALEQPFYSLDAVYTYYPSFNSKIKLKIKNLLGEDQEVTQSDVIVRFKEVGTEYSVSYSYDF